MRDGPLGLLMLDTAFERFPGDVGHPETFASPMLVERVAGATAARVTTLGDGSLLAPFLAGARRLEARGASVITTSCGFPVLYQDALAAAVRVPVVTSALLQVPWLASLLRRPVGVLTFDPAKLGAAHLAAAGADPATPVGGLRPCSLMRRDILGGAPADFATREAEVVEAALALVAAHPGLGALVLECTNFPPHAATVAQATGRPVYDIVTLVRWTQAGLGRVGAHPIEGLGAPAAVR